MVDACYLPVIPGDSDRIPTGLCDDTTVSGVALPVDAGAPLKVLGFGDCHRPIGFPIRAPVAGEKGAQNERPTRRLVERPGPSQEYRICQNEPYATLRGSREGDDA